MNIKATDKLLLNEDKLNSLCSLHFVTFEICVSKIVKDGSAIPNLKAVLALWSTWLHL